MPVKGCPIISPLNSETIVKSLKALVVWVPLLGSPIIGQLTVASHVPI